MKNEDKSQKASAPLRVGEDHFVLPRDHENGLRGPMCYPVGAAVPCSPHGDPSAAWVHPSLTPRHWRGRFATKDMTQVLDLEMRLIFLGMAEDRGRCSAPGRMGSGAAGDVASATRE